MLNVAGDELWYHATFVPVKDEDDQLESVLIVSVNLTERKKAEKVLSEKMRELSVINKMMVGRELRMIELKKEVNTLSEELGKCLPYDIS